MSVDYTLVCERHRVAVDICTDGLSGPMLNCDKRLATFCVTHRNCDLRISDEHDVKTEDYVEFSKETEVDYGLD